MTLWVKKVESTGTGRDTMRVSDTALLEYFATGIEEMVTVHAVHGSSLHCPR